MIDGIKYIISLIGAFFSRIIGFFLRIGDVLVHLLVFSPIILIVFGLTAGATAWIFGQITALLTMGKFVAWSYFDMSKYPAHVQQAFVTKPGMHFWETFNIYTTPVYILFFIELALVMYRFSGIPDSKDWADEKETRAAIKNYLNKK